MYITSSVIVIENLKVDVYLQKIRLLNDDLKCIVSLNQKLSKWSQIDNILASFKCSLQESNFQPLIKHRNI